MSPSPKSDRLLRDFLSLSRARIFGQIAALVAFLLVVWKTGPEEIGLYFLAATARMLVTHLVENGLGATLLSRPRIHDGEVAAVAVLAALVTAGIAALLLLAGGLVALQVSPGEAGRVFLIFALVALLLPFQAFAALRVVEAQRRGAFSRIAAARATGSALGLGATAALTAAGGGVWALIAFAFGQPLAILWRLDRLPARRGPILLRAAFARRLAGRSLRNALESGSGPAVEQAELILLGVWLGPAATGLYALGLRIMTATVGLLSASARDLARPILAASLGKVEGVEAEFRTALLRLSWLGVLIMSLLAWASTLVPPGLLRADWRPVLEIMPFICLLGCFLPVLSMLTSYLWARGRLMRVVQARLCVIALLIAATALGLTSFIAAVTLFIALRLLVLLVFLALGARTLGPRPIAATVAALAIAAAVILPALWV